MFKRDLDEIYVDISTIQKYCSRPFFEPFQTFFRLKMNNLELVI